jgi:hypothetical protein
MVPSTVPVSAAGRWTLLGSFTPRPDTLVLTPSFPLGGLARQICGDVLDGDGRDERPVIVRIRSTLRHLVPERIDDPVLVEDAPSSDQPGSVT